MSQKKYNPERSWKGRSYKKGGQLIKELKDQSMMVAIGYDTHISAYTISQTLALQLLEMIDCDEINHTIVNNGTASSCDDGDIFFDYSNNDVTEFQAQLQSYVSDNL